MEESSESTLPRDLPASVANALASALVQHLAETTHGRVLLIKGIVASSHGLRPERVSADIDVLVTERSREAMSRELMGSGWYARPETEASTALSAHSATYSHPEWPTDIDLHHRFPGFLGDADVTFEALWAERAEFDFGGVSCASAGPLGSALIAALHSLRHDDDDARHDYELRTVTEVVRGWASEQQVKLAALAELTGAAGPLEQWFAELGIPVVASRSPALVDWHARRHSGDTFAGQFVAGIAGTPWRQRPRLLWIAFWPRGDELRASHPEIGSGPIRLLGARFTRWGRGLRDAPRAIRSLYRARRRGDQ